VKEREERKTRKKKGIIKATALVTCPRHSAIYILLFFVFFVFRKHEMREKRKTQRRKTQCGAKGKDTI
jgi:hypothetical protein